MPWTKELSRPGQRLGPRTKRVSTGVELRPCRRFSKQDGQQEKSKPLLSVSLQSTPIHDWFRRSVKLGKPRATPRPVRNMEQNGWWVEIFHCIELLNCINWSSVFQIMAYWILRNKSSEFQFMSQSNVGSGESKLHERSFRTAQQNRLFSLFGSTTSGSWKRTAAVSP